MSWPQASVNSATNELSIVSSPDEAMYGKAIEKLDLEKEVCQNAQATNIDKCCKLGSKSSKEYTREKPE